METTFDKYIVYSPFQQYIIYGFKLVSSIVNSKKKCNTYYIVGTKQLPWYSNYKCGYNIEIK